MVAVSIVVPVYNPGERIRTVLDSLDAQSMRDFEVILVDDGSTDRTPALLAQYAATRENVTVTGIPNSGWPGRPRNVGTDLARGEYVLYMDHDDALPDDGLERWFGYAAATGADICVGKESRPGGLSAGLVEFRADVPDAELVRDHLAFLWTPHKLYRRSLLDEHGIRFPEGPTRLEDHHFNVRAFRRAGRVALLSSHVVYRWTNPREVTHSTRFDSLDIYWGALDALIDLVGAEWPEGPERDAILLRWWGRKVLKRASAPRYSGWSDAFRATLFPHLRAIDARFPARLHAGLPPVRRLQSQLLRAGDEQGLLSVARTQERIAPRASTTRVAWESGALTVEFEVWAMTPDGPFTIPDDADGQISWGPLDEVGRDGLPALSTDLVQELAAASVMAVLRDPRAQEDWPLPTTFEPSVRPAGGGTAAVLKVRAVLDPRSARAGRALGEGRHEIVVLIDWFGRYGRVRVLTDTPRLSAIVDDQQLRAYRSAKGVLRVQSGEAGGPVWRPTVAETDAATIDREGGALRIRVPLAGVHVAGPMERAVDLAVGHHHMLGRVVRVGSGLALELEVQRSTLTRQLPRYPDGRIPVRWSSADGTAGTVVCLTWRPGGFRVDPPESRRARSERGSRAR